jgi:hypothetical protein
MPPYQSPRYWQETGLEPAGLSLTITQVSHIERAFNLYAAKVRAFTLKVGSEEALRDKGVLQALRLLALDGRLDPSLQAAIRRELASRE